MAFGSQVDVHQMVRSERTKVAEALGGCQLVHCSNPFVSLIKFRLLLLLKKGGGRGGGIKTPGGLVGQAAIPTVVTGSKAATEILHFPPLPSLTRCWTRWLASWVTWTFISKESEP